MKMRHRMYAAAFVVAASPLAAGAETCPVQADLASGIVLSMADGSFTLTSRARPNGIEVTSTSTLSEGAPFSAVSTFAHALAMPRETPTTPPTHVTYAAPVAGLDDLPQTRTWSSDFEFTKNGVVTATGTQTSTITGFGELTVGDCAYDVWRVKRSIEYSDGFGMHSEHVYAPDLGIILGETNLDSSGSALAAVFFDHIAAE